MTARVLSLFSERSRGTRRRLDRAAHRGACSMTSPAEWLVPARERLDRRQARLEEVFGTLDVPDGGSER